MDIFQQNKMLYRLVVVMLIVNVIVIGLLVYFRMDSSGGQTRGGRQKDSPTAKQLSLVLKKELDLTDTQTREIERIRQSFFEKERVLAAEIKEKRDSMNLLMFNKEENDRLVVQLARGVAEREFDMELLRMQQAKSFRQVCTPTQLNKLQTLVKEIRDYFKPANPKEIKSPC